MATPRRADLDVVVAIPTLNEASHIESLIRRLLEDPVFAGDDRTGLWIVDGGSEDGTRDLVERLAAMNEHLQLIDNPGRTQARAINLAAELARQAGARILVRLDAHAGYPRKFISTLMATQRGEDCDSVVVPMRTVGGGPMRDAAADLYNSWLGNGGAPHRSGNVRGYVEHGHHAAFRLEAFLATGGYDDRFIANEDAELDKRIIASGGRIFLENTTVVDYIPRDTVQGFWRQMWRNGRFRMWTAAKHRERPGLRQLLPMAVSLGIVGSVLAGLFWPPLFAPVAAYLLLVTVLAIGAATKRTPGRVVRIIVLAVTSHLAFGLGAIRGVFEVASPGWRQTSSS